MSTYKSNWKISDFVAHSQDVLCAALNPSNGRTLATGGEDKRVNLWLVGQCHNITSISGLGSPVESVVFSNSEECLGAGFRSGLLKVFDLNENKVLRSISGHKAPIRSLAFHRYGDILASGSMDTNIKLWDVRRKGCLYTYKGHSEVINSLQFSPDGKWLVSGSSDKTAKIWDLTAAKCFHDFTRHSGAINDVQFHPKEFLLAIASSDRTISFWDLEEFSEVSLSSPESCAIRRILFHPSGDAVFSGSQDSLRVHGWEPSNQFDYLPISWGKVVDIQVSCDQLIGVSFLKTNVTLWCVDIQKLKPWGNLEGKRGSISARRQFHFHEEEVVPQRPPTQPSGPPQKPLINEESMPEVGGDSPPFEVKDEYRMSVFKSREELVRTPPKQIQLQPFQPPNDYNIEFPQVMEPHPIIRDFQPVVQPQPPHIHHVGLREVLRDVHTAHTDVCAILQSRLDIIERARAQWSINDPIVALEVAVNSGNQSSIVDILSILNLKRSLWTLDMSMLILPELRILLRSKHEVYIECSCLTLKLILKCFSSVITSNMRQNTTPNSGVDIAKEERLEKCEICYSHLQQIRHDIYNTPQTNPAHSLVTRISTKLKLNEAFSLLD